MVPQKGTRWRRERDEMGPAPLRPSGQQWVMIPSIQPRRSHHSFPMMNIERCYYSAALTHVERSKCSGRISHSESQLGCFQFRIIHSVIWFTMNEWIISWITDSFWFPNQNLTVSHVTAIIRKIIWLVESKGIKRIQSESYFWVIFECSWHSFTSLIQE